MKHGGARPGAGRPKGHGKYKEPTQPIRIPQSMVESVLDFVASEGYALPLYTSTVQAGFPCPADDHMEGKLDLNQHLVKHPTATFFVKVSGESMLNAGIHPGDILVVDRSLTPKHGKIVVAAVDGNLTVKRLHRTTTATQLMPENEAFSPIQVHEESNVVIWGVVTNVLHAV